MNPAPKPAPSASRETSALQAFDGYTQAFQRLDPSAMPVYFETPALMISPRGSIALSDAAAVERMYADVMADAKAKAYERSELYDLMERRLSTDWALITGDCAWIDNSGRVLQRIGLSYTLRRSQGTWRLVVTLIHEPRSG